MLVVGKEYEVKVVRMLSKGIVVRILSEESDNTEFIHLSKISSKFVSDVSDFVSMGEVLTAKAVESEIRGAELSLIHLNIRSKKEMNTDKDAGRMVSHIPTAYTPKIRHNKSLDEMIEDANRAYHDKMQSKKNINSNRRK